MSDSDSKDSDEGIRYKTDSVRNKSKEIDRGTYNEKYNRSRHRKRYSRSPSPETSRSRTYSKNIKKRRKRSNSTSSSDDGLKNKYTRTESKKDRNGHPQKDKANTQKQSFVPVLPSRLHNKSGHKQTKNDDLDQKESDHDPKPQAPIGPILPTYVVKKKSDLGTTDEDLQLPQEEPQISSYIGPQLPPNMNKNENTKDIVTDFKEHNSEKHSIGPKLPPHMVQDKSDSIIGPSLPPNLRQDGIVIGEDQQRSNENPQPSCIGPQLPPRMAKCDKSELTKNSESTKNLDPQPSYIGPQLPPHMAKCDKSELTPNSESAQQNLNPEIQEDNGTKIIGPFLPPHLRKKIEQDNETFSENVEDEEETFGPLPPGSSVSSFSHKALEERALQLKIDQLGPKESDEPVRESWMIELPAAAANFGLGPRQFRNRAGPDLSDRSSWTDLPGDKNKKKSNDVPLDLKAEAELIELKKRDKEQELLTKKHKRKDKSLLTIHKEKLEKEKKDQGPSERRPFSRDIDLQVNRFDEAQKQAIMKKAQLLDDRFSSGKTKYL